jgi:flagellar hook-length control protein FliK
LQTESQATNVLTANGDDIAAATEPGPQQTMSQPAPNILGGRTGTTDGGGRNKKAGPESDKTSTAGTRQTALSAQDTSAASQTLLTAQIPSAAPPISAVMPPVPQNTAQTAADSDNDAGADASNIGISGLAATGNGGAPVPTGNNMPVGNPANTNGQTSQAVPIPVANDNSGAAATTPSATPSAMQPLAGSGSGDDSDTFNVFASLRTAGGIGSQPMVQVQPSRAGTAGSGSVGTPSTSGTPIGNTGASSNFAPSQANGPQTLLRPQQQMTAGNPSASGTQTGSAVTAGNNALPGPTGPQTPPQTPPQTSPQTSPQSPPAPQEQVAAGNTDPAAAGPIVPTPSQAGTTDNSAPQTAPNATASDGSPLSADSVQASTQQTPPGNSTDKSATPKPAAPNIVASNKAVSPVASSPTLPNPPSPSETNGKNISPAQAAMNAASDGKAAHTASTDAPSPQPVAAPPAAPAAAPAATQPAPSPQAVVTVNIASGNLAPAAGDTTSAMPAHIAAHGTDANPATDATPNAGAIAVTIAARSLSGSKQFDIRLDPPELGHVEVRLSIDASGKTEAHMTADQPQTLALLQKDAPTLTRALRDAGLDVSQSGLNFSLKGQDRNSGGNGFNTPSRSASLPLAASKSIEAAQASISLPSQLGDARLDIHV